MIETFGSFIISFLKLVYIHSGVGTYYCFSLVLNLHYIGIQRIH